MFEKAVSCILAIIVCVVSFVIGKLSSNGRRTTTTRDELARAGELEQSATRETENARTTVNDIRQTTSELADETRTSESIINECKQIIEEIRNKNDMEASK